MPALVTVVIPTRNRASLVVQTLHTVRSQNIDHEVVVVDEGSTDGTGARLEALGDPRVRVLRHERAKGLSAARNAGIAAATGQFVAFVDDDDLWLAGKLEAQVAAMEREGVYWCYGGSLEFAPGLRLLHVHDPLPARIGVERLPYVNSVPGGGSNVIASRHALERVGGFDVTLSALEDWDMWVRLSQVGSPAVVHRPVVAYRLHGGNMSKQLDRMLEAADRLDERYRHLRGGQSLDWDDLYRWLGAAALRNGDRRGARRLALRAIRAGHRGAWRRLTRTLVLTSDEGRSSVALPWPDDTRAWVEQALRSA